MIGEAQFKDKQVSVALPLFSETLGRQQHERVGTLRCQRFIKWVPSKTNFSSFLIRWVPIKLTRDVAVFRKEPKYTSAGVVYEAWSFKVIAETEINPSISQNARESLVLTHFLCETSPLFF